MLIHLFSKKLNYIVYCKTLFPSEFLPAFRDLNIGGATIKGNRSAELSPLMTGVVLLEIFRIDPSLGTFYFVDNLVSLATIDLLGSEDQKAKYIPDGCRFKNVYAFGLTEPNYGSDASNIHTTAEKIAGGYIINGEKRWIGNALHSKAVIIWAKVKDTNEIKGFLVENGTQGMTMDKIEGKYALRSVQNADIKLTDVFVTDSQVLEKGNNWATGPGRCLKHSRVYAAWCAWGIAAGAYDFTMKYIKDRKQFGKSISSFQISQEKLARMMGNLQAMIHLSMTTTMLYEKGKASFGQVSLCKAWCTQKAREWVSLGRELLGGNGILLENQLMKLFMDIEAIHTYEGSYEINMLIAGRELTGVSSIR